MKASVSFLSRYLDPPTLSAQEAEHALTLAGFPIDAREALPGGDCRLEVEITSNRGDCLSIIGLAREIAARGGHRLRLPDVPPAPGSPSDPCSGRLVLEVTTPDCPRFTVHIIRNCTIGPSPAWLVRALESVGQRSINNVVDITNFLNFEFGQPCHAFDLARLAGGKLVVRTAREGEALTTLDGKKRSLKADEVVVADAQGAQSLAGVMGGQDSEVTAATRDIAFEVATWNPVAVRRAARRHQLRTDASHRFERLVDPRTLDLPARRGAALIAELTKGTLCAGMLDSATVPAAPLREVQFRPTRCRALLGIDVSDQDMAALLERIGIATRAAGAAPVPRLACTIPAWRPDLTREVDLVEEVARLRGFDAIPIHPRMTVQVRGPQVSESADVELARVLTAQGFFETVTFSFITPAQAAPFLAPSLALLAVADDRRKSDGTLRPSTIPSLLACCKKNQDSAVTGGIRLFETASVFADPAGPRQAASGQLPLEPRTLALIMDVPGAAKGKPGTVDQRQLAVRILRGAIESAVHALGGGSASVELRPCDPPISAFEAGATAQVILNGAAIGHLGPIAAPTQRLFDLDLPIVAAELTLAPLLALFPPRSRVAALPAFPAIERDLSLDLSESVSWSAIRGTVLGARLDKLEGVAFVGTYRGKPLPPGKKAVTLRLSFRDASRTLRREEVDPQMATLVATAKQALGAELRA